MPRVAMKMFRTKDKKLWTITYQLHKHPPTAPSLVEITMTITNYELQILNICIKYTILYTSQRRHELV